MRETGLALPHDHEVLKTDVETLDDLHDVEVLAPKSPDVRRRVVGRSVKLSIVDYAIQGSVSSGVDETLRAPFVNEND